MKIPLIALILPLMMCSATKVLAGKPMYEGLDSVEKHEITGLGIVQVGQELIHPKFGIGKVKEIQIGEDKNTIINIVFISQGPKWLIAEHANLKRITE